MINVLSIASYRYLPVVTGGQKNIALFYTYLSRYINLTCITVKNNVVPAGNMGYDVRPILSNSPLRYINPFYFFTLQTIIKQKNITHVMLEHPYYGWLGYLLKKMLHVKLVIHSHNIEALRFKSLGRWWWRILWWYEKCTHRSADINFFITEEDRLYAIQHFRLKEDSCIVTTYGTEHEKASTHEEKQAAKQVVCKKHEIAEHKLLFLYSAALNYEPNRKALDLIVDKINPLLTAKGVSYTILICGAGLPAEYNNLLSYKDQHILYAGFVEDISLYFTAADIFLNPVTEGGGIKTKLVEALAGNSSAITFQSGAYGVPLSITGNKLYIAPDNDIPVFFECLQASMSSLEHNIPDVFFKHFYWGSIAEKAVRKLKS